MYHQFLEVGQTEYTTDMTLTLWTGLYDDSADTEEQTNQEHTLVLASASALTVAATALLSTVFML